MLCMMCRAKYYLLLDSKLLLYSSLGKLEVETNCNAATDYKEVYMGFARRRVTLLV